MRYAVNKKLVTTMPIITSVWRYTRTAIALHWTLVVLLTLMAALGWYMMSIEDDPGSDWYFDTHKSMGLVIALLIAARIAWRLTHRPQALPARLPEWQCGLARGTQVLLYVVMVLMPITGYIGASYSKERVQWFGFAMPQWTSPDHDRAELFFGIHSVLIWILVTLVSVHALGALKHLLIDKDGVFQRMWIRH